MVAVLAGQPAASQESEAPQYIASMSSFEVRQLRGSFGPSNGLETMRAVTPSSWLTGDPGITGFSGVVVAWSGGAKGTGTKLVVHGGGHNDSANNGVYVYDFSGSALPTGFSLPYISSTSAVRQSSTYSDGAPSAAHTYDGMVYLAESNSIYRFGGAKWSESGGWYGLSARFDLATSRWAILPSYPGEASTEPSVIYDPSSSKILVTMTGQSNAAFYRIASNTWSSVRGTSREHHESAFAYDPTRSRAVMLGGGSATLYTIDWSNETFSERSLGATGSTAILNSRALAAFYDRGRDSFWIFGGQSGSSGYANIYEMDANTFQITQHGLSASMGGFEDSYQGSFGRFIFMDDWRAIGFLTRTDAAPFVIRLPPAEVNIAAPVPPSNFRTN